MNEFIKVKQSLAQNNERIEFFRKINEAIESFFEIQGCFN